MRVALLSDVYFPRINGVSTSIETFRRALPAFGVETLLVAPAYADEPATPDVIRLPARPVPRDPEDRLMSYRAALAVESQLRSAGIDLIHIQTPFVGQYAGLALARRLGVPVLATYHTLFEEYLHHYLPVLPAGILRGLARWLSRSQCNALDRVIVPSPAMARRLADYGVTTACEVLPTGIPCAQFGQGDGPRFRQAFGIPADRPVALFVGRVAFEKNIGFLIEAVDRARTRLPDLLFLIAGEGPARAALAAEVAARGLGDAVRFLDYLDRGSELPDCYAAADLFVFASRTETQGLVLLEALAAGTPVLALAEMGTTEIMAPGEGTVTSPDEPGAFATLLADLLTDRTRLATLAQAAPAHAERWSEQALAGRLARLYQDILDTHAPRKRSFQGKPLQGQDRPHPDLERLPLLPGRSLRRLPP
jgi:1,2-diacylglycerol 3-alpha-glucosyltransferase